VTACCKRTNHRNLGSLSATRPFFEECFATVDLRRETLWVAHLDEEANCLYLAKYQGDETSAPCPTEEILADAIEHGTCGLVLAHNHPGGRSYPSMHDLRMTQSLAVRASSIQCTVVDHLIFAGAECNSFRQRRLECWLEPAYLTLARRQTRASLAESTTIATIDNLSLEEEPENRAASVAVTSQWEDRTQQAAAA